MQVPHTQRLFSILCEISAWFMRVLVRVLVRVPLPRKVWSKLPVDVAGRSAAESESDRAYTHRHEHRVHC